MTPNPSTRLPLRPDLGAPLLKRGSCDHSSSFMYSFGTRPQEIDCLYFLSFQTFQLGSHPPLVKPKFWRGPCGDGLRFPASSQHSLARPVTELCGTDKLSSPSPTQISVRSVSPDVRTSSAASWQAGRGTSDAVSWFPGPGLTMSTFHRLCRGAYHLRTKIRHCKGVKRPERRGPRRHAPTRSNQCLQPSSCGVPSHSSATTCQPVNGHLARRSSGSRLSRHSWCHTDQR
ncbi:uncharacterized protein LOC122231381 isoform X1 [Panthera tigris]|uniref:uncharacterized protein LOC122231381 isoform X1 n=1 Tax=Panthera tigris TaxID=9694 RepID=UPI001C6FBA8B|nr:uncharacterized protein LOC122231381 isoform X1 [Panthera tigris]